MIVTALLAATCVGLIVASVLVAFLLIGISLEVKPLSWSDTKRLRLAYTTLPVTAAGAVFVGMLAGAR